MTTKRVLGRSIYITSLAGTVEHTEVERFADRCKAAHLHALWIRLARGQRLDDNFRAEAKWKPLRDALARVGIETWGWHVPFCQNPENATAEATRVAHWCDEFKLDGLLVDAERTRESPRFQGGDEEARLYCEILSKELSRQNRGLALSSHDQPQLHGDLPFQVFLEHVSDICPQVYYSLASIEARLKKSIAGYRALEQDRRDFADRYKPTGNITTTGDVRLPGKDACLAATRAFVARVNDEGFKAHSFWCLDEAPNDILECLRDIAA